MRRPILIFFLLFLTSGLMAEPRTLPVGTCDVPTDGYKWEKVKAGDNDAWRGIKGEETALIFAYAPGFSRIDEGEVRKFLEGMSQAAGVTFTRIRVQESDVPRAGSYKFAFQANQALGFGYAYTSHRGYLLVFLGLGQVKPVKEVKQMAESFKENSGFNGLPLGGASVFVTLAVLALLASSVRIGCLAAFGYAWILLCTTSFIRLAGQNAGEPAQLAGNFLGLLIFGGFGVFLVRTGSRSREALGVTSSLTSPTPAPSSSETSSTGSNAKGTNILVVCLTLLLVLLVIGYLNSRSTSGSEPTSETEVVVDENADPMENAQSTYESGDYEAAAEWAEKALDSGLEDREQRLKARRILGSSLYKSGDYGEAQEQYKILSKAEPANEEYKSTLAVLAPLVKQEEAEEAYQLLADAEQDLSMQRFDPARQKVKEALQRFKAAADNEGISEAKQLLSAIDAERAKVTAIVPVAPKPKKSYGRSSSSSSRTSTSSSSYPTVSKREKRRRARERRRRERRKRRRY